MAYDDEQTRKSRVVVETPTARREVVRTETAHVPDRRGMSGGLVAALVIGAVALVTILFLFLMNRPAEDTTNANVTVASQPTPLPQTTIVEQVPAPQQPPIIIQQPAPPTQSAPIIVTQPPSSGESRPSGPDDATIQSNIQKRFSDDQTLASLGLTALVIDGKVTLTGTVKTEALKRQVEKLVREVRGVRGIDNQILVLG